MLVFGLTGGVASGKSTIAEHFRRRGIPVIDADVLAREVVAPGTPGLAEILRTFGNGVATSGGELDRARLAELVFSDPENLQRLERIVHPLVAEALKTQLETYRLAGHGLVGYDVPLLFERGLEKRFSPVVLVAASPARQLERAMRRNGWREDQAWARIRAQLPLEHKRRLADYVIDNDGSLESASAQADDVLASLRARANGG